MTFLIKNKMEKKKQACKFWPPLLHGFKKKNKPVISQNLHLITLSFSAGGERNCFKFEVYNLLCYNNKTYCVYMCGSLQTK